MTIFSVQSDPNPMTFTEFSINTESNTVTVDPPDPGIDYCFCDVDCDFRQLVLAGSNDYETDTSSFLITNNNPTGTFQIFIRNITTGIETELTDNTYGTYYALGFEPLNSNKGGYIINWGLVRDNLGFGRYKIRIVNNRLTDITELTTYEYTLQPYSPETADGTIRLKTIRNGCIIDGIDYSDLNWNTDIRIPGFFYEIEPRIDQTTFPQLNYKEANIKKTVIRRFKMDTKLIPDEITSDIKNDAVFHDMYLTTYELIKHEELRNINVIDEDFETFQTYRGSRRAQMSIVFEEKKQSRIKYS